MLLQGGVLLLVGIVAQPFLQRRVQALAVDIAQELQPHAARFIAVDQGLGVLAPGAGTVSYTHLDVYKRQVLGDHADLRAQAFLGDAGDVLAVDQDAACLLYTSRCV